MPLKYILSKTVIVSLGDAIKQNDIILMKNNAGEIIHSVTYISKYGGKKY